MLLLWQSQTEQKKWRYILRLVYVCGLRTHAPHWLKVCSHVHAGFQMAKTLGANSFSSSTLGGWRVDVGEYGPMAAFAFAHPFRTTISTSKDK